MDRIRVFFSRVRKWCSIIVLYIPIFFYFYPEFLSLNSKNGDLIVYYVVPFISGLVLPSALMETFDEERGISIFEICFAGLAFLAALVLSIIFINWYVPLAFIVGCGVSTMIVDLANEYIEEGKLFAVKAVFWVVGGLCVFGGGDYIYRIFEISEVARKNITDLDLYTKGNWATGISFILVGYILCTKGFAIGQFEKIRDAYFNGIVPVSRTRDAYGNETVVVENRGSNSLKDVRDKADKI